MMGKKRISKTIQRSANIIVKQTVHFLHNEHLMQSENDIDHSSFILLESMKKTLSKASLTIVCFSFPSHHFYQITQSRCFNICQCGSAFNAQEKTEHTQNKENSLKHNLPFIIALSHLFSEHLLVSLSNKQQVCDIFAKEYKQLVTVYSGIYNTFLLVYLDLTKETYQQMWCVSAKPQKGVGEQNDNNNKTSFSLLLQECAYLCCLHTHTQISHLFREIAQNSTEI